MHVIASQIRNGAYGNCRILVDAECHERYQAFPCACLPFYKQGSRPDINLFVVNDLPQQQQQSYIPARTQRDAEVHLVEVGYTSDTRVHEHVQIKTMICTCLLKIISTFNCTRICSAMAGGM